MQQTGTSRGPTIAIAITLIAIAGLIIFALSSQPEVPSTTADRSTESVTETRNDTTDHPAPAPGDRMAITYTDNGFEPADISVKKGTVVTVTNKSSHDVQLSSDDHPSHRKNPEMNLPALAPGESGSYTATKVGTWGYHDHLDPTKTGTVTVEE